MIDRLRRREEELRTPFEVDNDWGVSTPTGFMVHT